MDNSDSTSATDEVLGRIAGICQQRGLFSLISHPPQSVPLIAADVSNVLESWHTQLKAAMLMLIYAATESLRVGPLIEFGDNAQVPTIVVCRDKRIEQFVRLWSSDMFFIALSDPDSERQLSLLIWYLASRRNLHLIASAQHWSTVDIDELLSHLNASRAAAEEVIGQFDRYQLTGPSISQEDWKKQRNALRKRQQKALRLGLEQSLWDQ